MYITGQLIAAAVCHPSKGPWLCGAGGSASSPALGRERAGSQRQHAAASPLHGRRRGRITYTDCATSSNQQHGIFCVNGTMWATQSAPVQRLAAWGDRGIVSVCVHVAIRQWRGPQRPATRPLRLPLARACPRAAILISSSRRAHTHPPSPSHMQPSSFPPTHYPLPTTHHPPSHCHDRPAHPRRGS